MYLEFEQCVVSIVRTSCLHQCVTVFPAGKGFTLPVQVFHLPEAMLHQAEALSEAPGDVEDREAQQIAPHVDDFADASSTDTGRWGKQLHEPSHFLAHELWGKLGKA